MLAHAQVVVAAPHCDVSSLLQGSFWIHKVFCRRKLVGRASKHTKAPVRVVIDLGLYLPLEEGIIVKFPICLRKNKQRRNE